MLKTYLYIPDELEIGIKETARSQKKSRAEVIRESLKEGLSIVQRQGKGGAEVLLEIAKLAKKHNLKGPEDSSVNLDYYLWGLPKKSSR